MPKCKRTNPSEVFTVLASAAAAHNETNDCGVRAICVTTGAPYAEVHALMASNGRKARRGSPLPAMIATCKALGFTMRKWTISEKIEVIHTYPRLHPTPSKITTHHPRRFAKAWAPYAARTLMFRTRNHILGVVKGEVLDWSINNSLPVTEVYEITKD